MTETEVAKLREKVEHAIKETSKNLYEREELSRLTWLAVISNLNMLVLGDPGTAKTQLATNLTKTIKKGRIFKYTLNAFVTVDELFGTFDLVKLHKDNIYVRNTKNKLPDCDIAYIDEFFKGNSGTLNALLEIMNEKSYTDSYGTIETPLKFLISSSNELPSKEDNLEAILDRFQVKYLVKSIQDHTARITGYKNTNNKLEPIKQIMSTSDIDNLREEVLKVEFTKEASELLERIYQEIAKNGIYISDRTVFKSIPLIKAVAFMSKRKKVIAEDLLILMHTFWNELSEQKTARKIILSLADPLSGKIDDIWDVIQDEIEKTREKLNKKNGSKSSDKYLNIVEIIEKIKDSKKRIAKYVDIMKQTDVDSSDAELKITKLNNAIKEIAGTEDLF